MDWDTFTREFLFFRVFKHMSKAELIFSIIAISIIIPVMAFTTAGDGEDLGQYNPTTGEIKINDEAIDRMDMDREAIILHEKLHRRQQEVFPFYYDLLPYMKFIFIPLFIVSGLRLSINGMRIVALIFFFDTTILEIHASLGTFLILGNYYNLLYMVVHILIFVMIYHSTFMMRIQFYLSYKDFAFSPQAGKW